MGAGTGATQRSPALAALLAVLRALCKSPEAGMPWRDGSVRKEGGREAERGKGERGRESC